MVGGRFPWVLGLMPGVGRVDRGMVIESEG